MLSKTEMEILKKQLDKAVETVKAKTGPIRCTGDRPRRYGGRRPDDRPQNQPPLEPQS